MGRLFWFFKRLARCFISDLIFFPTVMWCPAYKFPCTRHPETACQSCRGISAFLIQFICSYRCKLVAEHCKHLINLIHPERRFSLLKLTHEIKSDTAFQGEFSSHAIRHGLYIKNRKRLFHPQRGSQTASAKYSLFVVQSFSQIQCKHSSLVVTRVIQKR